VENAFARKRVLVAVLTGRPCTSRRSSVRNRSPEYAIAPATKASGEGAEGVCVGFRHPARASRNNRPSGSGRPS